MTVWRRNFRRSKTDNPSTDTPPSAPVDAHARMGQSTTAGHRDRLAAIPGESVPLHSGGPAEPSTFVIGVASVLGCPGTHEQSHRLSARTRALLAPMHWPESSTSTAVQHLLRHNGERGDDLHTRDLLRRQFKAERAGEWGLAHGLDVLVERKFEQRRRVGL